MVQQFGIYAASRGDDFNGIVSGKGSRPDGLLIAPQQLKLWYNDLRRGQFDGIGGIGAVKETVVAAGGTMVPPKQYAELTDVPSLLQQYKDAKGDDFDGTVHQNDNVPGIGDCGYLYLRLAQIISGRCDQQDGIAEIKAEARRMGYFITAKDFLKMLQMYVQAMGRGGLIHKHAIIKSVNSGKMHCFVAKARAGTDVKLKERIDAILGPHPNDLEALDALCSTLQSRVHAIAGGLGLLSPGVSEDWDIKSDLYSELTQQCVERFATVSHPIFAAGKGTLTPSLAPELFQKDGRAGDVLVCLLELMEGWDPSSRPNSKEATKIVTDLVTVLSFTVCKTSYKLPETQVNAIVDGWVAEVTEFAKEIREDNDIKAGRHCCKYKAFTDDAPHKEMRDSLFDSDTTMMIATMSRFVDQGEANLVTSKARRSAKATVWAVVHISETVDGDLVDVWNIAGGRRQKRSEQRKEMTRTFDHDSSCVLFPRPMQFCDLDNANHAEARAQMLSKSPGGFLYMYQPAAIFPSEANRPAYLKPLPVTVRKMGCDRLRKETKDDEALYQTKKASHTSMLGLDPFGMNLFVSRNRNLEKGEVVLVNRSGEFKILNAILCQDFVCIYL